MELSGFPHKGVGDACYFPAAYIQKYLNDFTDHFNLRQYIKVGQAIPIYINNNYICYLFLCKYIYIYKNMNFVII